MSKKTSDSLEKDHISCKILLLGIGGSGKSTLTYQIRTEKDKNNKEELLKGYTPHVYTNIFLQASQICKLLIEQKCKIPKDKEHRFKEIINMGQMPSDDLECYILKDIEHNRQSYFKFIFNKNTTHYKSFINLVSVLEIKPFLDLLESKVGYTPIYNIEYFFDKNNLDRIGKKNYIPTHLDVLMSRKKSVGIQVFKYSENDVTFQINDVGGQKSERKKWRNIMQNIDILIYVISLTDYEEALYEDSSSNSMVVSKQVFESVINNESFKNSEIILFFNKNELFKKLITKEDKLSKVFEEYKGGNDYEKGRNFIIDMYINLVKDKEKITYLLGNAIKDESIQDILKEISHVSKKVVQKNIEINKSL